MSRRFVISISATNRTGVLASVTTALAELGGDLVEASVDVICGHFTMLLAADFPDYRKQDVIIDHLRDYGQPFGLQIIIKELTDISTNQTVRERFQSGQHAFLSVLGQDSPGIARGISALLARESIDIVDMYGVSDSDAKRFAMAMEVTLPEHFMEDILREQLRDFEMLNHIMMSFQIPMKDEPFQSAELMVKKMIQDGFQHAMY
jgi:predicted amino acid-binding ACT domain protein